MTLQEAKEVLAVVASSFPKYFSNITRDSAERQAILWYEDLCEYSQEAVMSGVKAYRTADSTGFPPTTGQIISYIHLVGHPSDTSGTEAWALVRRAVNCPWDQMEASFNTLPKTVQKAVGNVASLKELAMMDTQKFESVAQSNFLRIYDAEKRKEAVEQRISNSVMEKRDSIRHELEMRRPKKDQLQIDLIEPQKIPEPESEPSYTENTGQLLENLRRKLGRKQ